MIIIESIKLAFKSIWMHKFRSFLTMLGILIGISSVVLLVSLGEGVKEDIKKMVGDLGSNMIFVIGGDIGIGEGSMTGNEGGVKTAFGNPANLISADIFKSEDMTKLQKVNGIDEVAPMGLLSGIVSYDDKIVSPTTMSTTPEMQDILTGLKIDKGRFLEQSDIDEKKQVAVVGSIVTDNLFPDEDPIGKKIKITNQNNEYEFEIIGAFAQSTSSSMFSSDMDSIMAVPYSTAKELFYGDEDKILRIALKADDDTDPKVVAQAVKEDMLSRHKEGEFSVLTQDDMLGMLDDILNMMTMFIAAIAAISLVVGGVGIMNIMLVTVTERTREIGLRKAVGATNSAILFQFLMEAIILSVLAGIISLLMVELGVEIVKLYTDIHPVVTVWSITISMAVCISIGLIFGLAPAMQASRKDPIEALRYE